MGGFLWFPSYGCFDFENIPRLQPPYGDGAKTPVPRYKAENEYMACLEVGVFKPSRSDFFCRPLFDMCHVRVLDV